MNPPNNASNSRTDSFARNRFRSVTKDVRRQSKPLNRALDFSRLRFQSVYRRASRDQTTVTLNDSLRTEYAQNAVSRIEFGQNEQNSPTKSSPTESTQLSQVIQTNSPPTTTEPPAQIEQPVQTKPNGLSNLFLSLRSDNPFFSGIEAMPDIRPRKKSIPLVSELVLKVCLKYKALAFKNNVSNEISAANLIWGDRRPKSDLLL